MKKDKTINLAARMMAEARWKGVSPKERSEVLSRAAKTPRTAKRCFCGQNSMLRAADRYFDCCRKAGIITLNREEASRSRRLAKEAEETNECRNSESS